jgi:hypothetical protein
MPNPALVRSNTLELVTQLIGLANVEAPIVISIVSTLADKIKTYESLLDEADTGARDEIQKIKDELAGR